MEDAILGASLCIIVGIVCIVIGILNRMGNISMLHSYHINNIKEEDKLPFGKMIGIGMITIGITLPIYGAALIVAEVTKENSYMIIADILLVVGIVLCLLISLYAIKKYNKKKKLVKRVLI